MKFTKCLDAFKYEHETQETPNFPLTPIKLALLMDHFNNGYLYSTYLSFQKSFRVALFSPAEILISIW